MAHLLGRRPADQPDPDAPAEHEWLVLSLWQPYASAFFFGLKTIETRAWRTNYRGPLYIHATKKFPPRARAFALAEYVCGRLPVPPEQLPVGSILGCVQVVEIERAFDLIRSLSHTEALYGDFAPGRWGWITERPEPLAAAIPVSGKQGLWRFARP